MSDDRPVRLISGNGFVEIADDDLKGNRDPDPTGVFEDEFDHMIRERGKAGYVPGHGLVDDLHQEILFRRSQKAISEHVAPTIRSNPPTARNAVLAGQSIVISGGTAIQKINWSGEDVETTTFTVTLFNQGAFTTAPTGTTPWPNRDNFANLSYRPYAIVQWGTRQSQASVTVDIGAGCQFTLGGSSCYVFLGMDAGRAGDTPSSMNLGCMLSFQPVQKFSPIRRTAYIDAVASAAITNIIVPTFAVSARLFSSSYSSGFLLTFKAADATVLYNLTIQGNNALQDILIANDVYSIDVQNLSGFPSTARLVFSLSF